MRSEACIKDSFFVQSVIFEAFADGCSTDPSADTASDGPDVACKQFPKDAANDRERYPEFMFPDILGINHSILEIFVGRFELLHRVFVGFLNDLQLALILCHLKRLLIIQVFDIVEVLDKLLALCLLALLFSFIVERLPDKVLLLLDLHLHLRLVWQIRHLGDAFQVFDILDELLLQLAFLFGFDVLQVLFQQ